MYNYAISKKTIANSSTEILAKNPNRKVVLLSNDSDEDIYVALGEAAIMNEGVILCKKTYLQCRLELAGETRFIGAIYGICSSGGKNLSIIEGE